MGEVTGIEWCDHTFNPWVGCTKVSPACGHCYAEGWAKRTGQSALWSGERRRTSESNWKQPLKWNRDASKAGARKRVFCASLADVFDNQADFVWRRDLWHLIEDTPALDWLLLTKRPQNIAKMLPERYGNLTPWPWPNVWLGTTVENQEESDRRIPHLLAVPAAVRFLSCEPLLGPIDLRHVTTRWGSIHDVTRGRIIHGNSPSAPPIGHIDWVIAGGERGPNARPWSIQWARELRDQCLAAGAPFFWKQNGEWVPAGLQRSETPGRYAFGDYEHDRCNMITHDCYPRQFTMFGARSVMQRVGKKAAGALLDGIEWRQTPTPGAA